MARTQLEGLQDQAERQYVALKARLRRRYRLARDLGFNAKMAKLLSARSEVYISRLAQELAKAGTDGVD